MCMSIRARAYLFVYCVQYVHMCIYICLCACMFVFVHLCVYGHEYVFVCICECLYECTYVCMAAAVSKDSVCYVLEPGPGTAETSPVVFAAV